MNRTAAERRQLLLFARRFYEQDKEDIGAH